MHLIFLGPPGGSPGVAGGSGRKSMVGGVAGGRKSMVEQQSLA